MNGSVGIARRWCGLNAGDERIWHVNGHRGFEMECDYSLVSGKLRLRSDLEKGIAGLPGLVIRA